MKPEITDEMVAAVEAIKMQHSEKHVAFALRVVKAVAPMIRAQERERCARVAEARDLSIMSSTAIDAEARKIGAAIRNLGDAP
jgi:hypothetical protein